ncbi:MAG: SDR family NAD(P)-dependent oxidoreductase [Eubacteriaceae bacterium]
MKQTVLITGASGGIGKACAEVFASHDFNEVLVARSADRLEIIKKELEDKYGITVTVIAADLTSPDEAVKIADKLEQERIQVDVLINNAGFGDHGSFVDSDWNKQKRMVELNVITLMQMCYVFGKQMATRHSGRILNIASIAGAMYSGPYMATYYATKAFVLSFSQSLAEELASDDVTVSALCPGPVATNFNKAASLKEGFKGMPSASPDVIARDAYRTVISGKAVSFPGSLIKLASLGVRVAPRLLIRKIAARVNGIPETGKLTASKQTEVS